MLTTKKKIPSFIPAKYHHEIRCLFGDVATDVWSKALGEIKDDDDFLRVAYLNESMKTASDGLLKSLSKNPSNTVSNRVLDIRTKTTKKEVNNETNNSKRD